MDIRQLLAMSADMLSGSNKDYVETVHSRGYNLFGLHSNRSAYNFPQSSNKRGKFKPRSRCNKLKG